MWEMSILVRTCLTRSLHGTNCMDLIVDRLEKRMDELEEKYQNERLADWKNKSEPLQKWLTAKAIEAKSQKEIGNDLLTVQKQLKDTKVTCIFFF